MPTRTPLNTVIHGRTERDEYTVEKVYFESAPGFFVTGNLYRPRNVQGKVPGVLFAHGHWQDARLSESGEAELLREIATGEERFTEGGRSRFQSMCVQLARMGCVVWQWDMLGNSDSQQLPAQLVHGFAKQRPEMNAAGNWGLFSPQAEAHLQSVMGLQTWNSIRSLDFLLSLPEVDPDRVAMTGASGGGTQTMLLAAIDPRLTLAFPAVMVSTAMQGGCTCENACLLRVETGNVEFAALFAPKPQGMTTANDWTREMAAKGFPQLKQLYTLMGAPDNVMLQRGEHFPHNYNAVSRSAFYGWLNRHFKLGAQEPVIERDYPRLTREQLAVWDDNHPRPPAGPEFERALLRGWHEDSQRQLHQAAESNPAAARTLVAQGLEIVLGRTLAEAGPVVLFVSKDTRRESWRERWGVLRNSAHREEVPVLVLDPLQPDGDTVLWLHARGKAGLLDDQGVPTGPIRALLAGGKTVVGLDLFMQGEFLVDGQPVSQTRRVKNPREAAAYTFGYNHSLFAQRVHDVLTGLAFIRDAKPRRMMLVGLDGAGSWAAAALSVAPGALAAAAIDTGGFRFASITDLQDPDFLPGGAKYADLPGMLAVAMPPKLAVAGESLASNGLLAWAAAAGSTPRQLTALPEAPGSRADAAVRWLLE